MDDVAWFWTKSGGNSNNHKTSWTFSELPGEDVVARDGIEPPTPAFSGPRSTTELSGLGNSKELCGKIGRPSGRPPMNQAPFEV
jgi:hypothetical protein